MSDFQVLLAGAVSMQLSTLFDESPSCAWGGVLVGEIREDKDSRTVEIYGALPATYRESLLDEFRKSSQIWKEFYAERDLRYPGTKIVGWYNYTPSVQWEPSERQTDLHIKFFDNPGQVFLFIDRNGDQKCYTANEAANDLVPCGVMEFEGRFSPRKASIDSSDLQAGTKAKAPVSQGLKKAAVFTLFFFISVLGLMYKDLTKPITSAAINPYERTVTEATTTSSAGTNPVYTIQSGDSLWQISTRLYGSGFAFYKILKHNQVYYPGNLYVGQKLTVPDKQ